MVRWVSGNPVKVDSGSDPTFRSATNATVINSIRNTTAKVPNVAGLSQAAAQTALAAANVRVGQVSSVVSAAPAGTVIAQNAPAGTIEPVNSSVNLTISQILPLNIFLVSDMLTQVGKPQVFQLAATGGVQPYAWSVSGLPVGMSATSAGAVSGTPAVVGEYDVNYTLSDGRGVAVSRTFHWSVTATETRLFFGAGSSFKITTAESLAFNDAQRQATGAGFGSCEVTDESTVPDGFGGWDASVTLRCAK